MKINWVELLDSSKAEIGMKKFHSTLVDVIDEVCPEKVVRVSTNRNIKEAWMTAGLLKCSNKQLKLYKEFITKKDVQSESKYKTYRDILKRTKRNCRREFYLKKCTEYRNNSKKMWQLINSVIGKSSDKRCIINELQINNIKLKDPKNIVNGLADHFAGVGHRFASQIKTSEKSITEYNQKIKRNAKSIMLSPTNEYEIAKILDNLVAKQSSGWDGISNKLIKELKTCLVTPLTIVFNRSITEGVFPSIMKTAIVTPLYKSGAKSLNTNYRPISLLMTISKILEKLMHNRTYNFLVQTNQIYQSQYGFRKKHSCEHAIQELLGTILKGFEKNEYTCAIFLDLSKAFDSLEHHVLLEKLDLYGIRGTALDWFKSYLSDRSLRVKCIAGNEEKETISEEYKVTYGVPQGSILGPLLFLVFCNDLPLNLDACKGILFADDTTIYKRHTNLNYLLWNMAEELRCLMDWFAANKLTLNLKKSVCMLFHVKDHKKDVSIKLDNIILPFVETTKFLGVWIDSKLTWTYHVNKLLIKLKQNMNLLKTGKNFMNVQCKKLVYYGHLQSHIAYCLSVWGNNVTAGTLTKLNKTQSKCVSLISRHKSMSNLGILSVTKLIELENMKFGYKLLSKELPVEILNCTINDHNGKTLAKQHGYNTRNKNIPNIPLVKNNKYRSSIFCKGSMAFLHLPENIKNIKNYSCFVRACKKHLLS